MARDYSQMYKEKLKSAQEVAGKVQPGEWIEVGMFNNKSVAFERELAARKNELSDMIVITAVSFPPIPETIMKDPKGEVFTFIDCHWSPLTRIIEQQRPNVYYNPTNFGENEVWMDLKATDPDKIGTRTRDWAVARVTPMDKDGYFNFGLSNAGTWTLFMTSKHPVVEVCKNMPYCYGGARERVHISDIEFIIEEDSPLGEMPPAIPTDIDRQIAGHVIEHIRNGNTIQLGIGGMPNALGEIINQTDLKDLGGHTEMLGNSYMTLMESGKMNNLKKELDRGKTAFTFAAGTKELYDWMDHNVSLASYNCTYINSPLNVARIDNLISINQALEVDIYGQVSAESKGFKQISGNGGMLDFVTGSFFSKGGRSLICLPSTITDKNGNLVSRVVPNFETGTICTIPRQTVNILVTEQGWVSLKGDSTWVRTEKIISIAHPRFRDELIAEAEKRRIWRRSNKIA